MLSKSEERVRQILWEFWLEMHECEKDIDGSSLPKDSIENNQNQCIEIFTDKLLNGF